VSDGRATRVATGAARIGLAVVAAASAVGLAVGARGPIGDGLAALVGWRGLVVVAALVVGAGAAWRGWPIGRALAWPPRRWFIAGAMIVALASGVWAHRAIAKGVPDVPDELGYLHTARTFAQGHLTAPSPPAQEFYYVSWGLHDHDRWYAVFPPGYGATLAIGVAVGAPGWINPLLGAALVLVLFLLAEHLLGRDHLGARIAIVLYLASWFRLMNAASFMAHPLAALLGALAVLGLLRGVVWPGEHRARWAGIGGAALGALVATRQLDAVIVAFALAPAIVLALVRAPRAAARRFALAVACGLPLVAGYLAYNRALTGAAMVTPQERFMAQKERRADCFRLGFGPGVGECPITQGTHFGKDGFAPKHAVANSRRRLDAWVRYAWGWTPLVLLPLLGLIAVAIRGGAAARRLALPTALFVGTVGGYGLFFYHGVIYGPRFYYLAWPLAVLASAAAIRELGLAVARLGRRGPLVAGGLAAALPALLVVGLHAAWPAVKQHAGRRPRTGDGKLVEALADPALRDALVFVDSMTLPATVTDDPVHPARNRPLVVKSLGDAADAGFARMFPDRRPLRMLGARFVPLVVAPDAPMRHEGGALYPLDDFRGGFGDRGTSPGLGRVELSAGAALRFALDGPARFSVPIWVIAADAGPMTVALAVVRHPGSPAIDVTIDGVAIATGLVTAAPGWAVERIELPAELTPGRHRLAIAAPTGRRGEVFALDHVELVPRR
jgi:hypothetical protein